MPADLPSTEARVRPVRTCWRRVTRHGIARLLGPLVVLPSCVVPALAQPIRHPPRATLTPADRQVLVASGRPVVDSNSPLIWDLVDGQLTLFVMTSIDGFAHVSSGHRLGAVGSWRRRPVGTTGHLAGRGWKRSIKADDGTWYGYYHNEVTPEGCAAAGTRVQPRIGAARSVDQGRTWTNLGIVLASPSAACDTTNQYFTGGVGDLSVVLSRDKTQLYLLYSTYTPALDGQGVSVARMSWADRDQPVGEFDVWDGAIWRPTDALYDDAGELAGWDWPHAQPLFTTSDSWHDGETANAFWGPSVHFNQHLQLYVMLLNRASTPGFGQEGIYVAFSSDLSNPRSWTRPAKLLDGGEWYPQVVGLEAGTGTDKEAGQTVRLFVSGVSEYLLTFGF